MSDNPLVLQYSDGQLVPYQTPDPAAATQRALDFTGIPDLAAGANALARGEWLPGLGQAASGASTLLPLGKLAGAAKLGAELMPLGGLIKAWHGTPHLFEPVEHNPFGEFRDAAIGTGEGTQAYGHGHYVAGNPGVAETYAYRPSDNENAGHLLEVHILPDEHELLDWDKPLADQHPNVLSAIDSIHAESEDLRILNSGPNITGEKFYKNLANHLWDKTIEGLGGGSAAASRALHEAGVPGLKYLDQGSRNFDASPISYADGRETWGVYEYGKFPSSKGEAQVEFSTRQEAEDYMKSRQTSNYVIFDPKNLRIVGRNGQRLEPVEEDPFK